MIMQSWCNLSIDIMNPIIRCTERERRRERDGGRDLSRRKNIWWKADITVTSINCRTDIKTTSNFPLCNTMSSLSNNMHHIKISRSLIFRQGWKINHSKVMKQSSNHSSGHCCRWTQTSFCNFRLAILSIFFFCIEGNWCERRKSCQWFWCQRESTCFNLWKRVTTLTKYYNRKHSTLIRASHSQESNN